MCFKEMSNFCTGARFDVGGTAPFHVRGRLACLIQDEKAHKEAKAMGGEGQRAHPSTTTATRTTQNKKIQKK